ncbi:MAG: MBL fold metallo-hydrolase [Desulfobacula sp.]|nr:MBL fold metallo-hydrolase [Desulfobacula sp.]
MKIKQFRYATDNLGYLVYAQGIGIAIDAGAVDGTIKFAKLNGVQIKYVTNTHSHHDHTPGNERLLKATNAVFIDCKKIKRDKAIAIGDAVLNIIPTPGHTDDSISFVTDNFMVTGDTLFNGTIGNCFSGDLHAFFNSLKRLVSYLPDTQVFAGHDYVVESLGIAKQIEPENKFIKHHFDSYNSSFIVSTIKDELNINPYIRFNAPGIIKKLEDKNLPVLTEFDRFKSIMENY